MAQRPWNDWGWNQRRDSFQAHTPSDDFPPNRAWSLFYRERDQRRRLEEEKEQEREREERKAEGKLMADTIAKSVREQLASSGSAAEPAAAAAATSPRKGDDATAVATLRRALLRRDTPTEDRSYTASLRRLLTQASAGFARSGRRSRSRKGGRSYSRSRTRRRTSRSRTRRCSSRRRRADSRERSSSRRRSPVRRRSRRDRSRSRSSRLARRPADYASREPRRDRPRQRFSSSARAGLATPRRGSAEEPSPDERRTPRGLPYKDSARRRGLDLPSPASPDLAPDEALALKRAAATRLAKHFAGDKAADAPEITEEEASVATFCSWLAALTTQKNILKTMQKNDIKPPHNARDKVAKLRVLFDFELGAGE